MATNTTTRTADYDVNADSALTPTSDRYYADHSSFSLNSNTQSSLKPVVGALSDAFFTYPQIALNADANYTYQGTLTKNSDAWFLAQNTATLNSDAQFLQPHLAADSDAFFVFQRDVTGSADAWFLAQVSPTLASDAWFVNPSAPSWYHMHDGSYSNDLDISSGDIVFLPDGSGSVFDSVTWPAGTFRYWQAEDGTWSWARYLHFGVPIMDSGYATIREAGLASEWPDYPFWPQGAEAFGIHFGWYDRTNTIYRKLAITLWDASTKTNADLLAKLGDRDQTLLWKIARLQGITTARHGDSEYALLRKLALAAGRQPKLGDSQYQLLFKLAGLNTENPPKLGDTQHTLVWKYAHAFDH